MSFQESLNKKRIFLFLLSLFFVFLIFSNENWNLNVFIGSNSALSIELPSIMFELIKTISTLIPYILLGLLLIIINIYYANLIDRSDIRRSLKFIISVVLILGLLTVLSTTEIENVRPDDDNLNNSELNIMTLSTTIESTTSESNSEDESFPLGNENLESISEIISFGTLLFNFLQILVPFLIIISALFFIMLMKLGNDYERESYIEEEEKISRRRYFDPKNEIRSKILKNYLEISDYLERKGVDPDFSLTPKEFASDAAKYQKIENAFDDITSIYEIARFSDLKKLDKSLLDKMIEDINIIKKEFDDNEEEIND